jgi:dimethylglycine dehydrogenase
MGSAGAGYQLFTNGGVRAAYTVCRLGEANFYLVAGASDERLFLDELWRSLSAEAGVVVRNVTLERGCFAVIGPAAREALAAVVDADLAADSWPPGHVRSISVGLAPDVRIMRVGSTGELGWELHHPIAYQRYLLDRLLAAGQACGMRLVGRRALNALRLEKSYAAAGPDMNAEVTAVEAGLADVLDLDKGPFVGRDAVYAELARGARRTLATIMIATKDASVRGHESVYHEGRLAGRITSGAFSPYFGQDVALALLPLALGRPGTELTVPVLDDTCAARVVAASPYDPADLRGRG